MLFAGALGAYELGYTRDQFSFQPEREFHRVVAEDFSPDGPPGCPELPARCLTYILPPGMKADSVSIKACDYKLVGEYYIYPTQPQVPSESTPRWVPPDSTIYNSKSPYPAAPIEIRERGFLDGASVVTVAVSPLMYIPVLREVYAVSRVEFEFYTSRAESPNRARIRDAGAQRTYDLALRAVVENNYEIPAYYQPPALTPERPPEAQNRSTFPYPCQYTIITNDLLADSFQPYADWLTDKGVPARVIKLSDVLHHFPGVDDAEKLRNYLKFGYEACGTVWVLLGGDAGIVPFRYGWVNNEHDTLPPNGDPDAAPSDLYFSDMNGNWNVDSLELPFVRWGEPYHDSVDVYPELLVGRLTVREPDKVHNWVRKMLYYEQIGSNDTSQFRRATWVYDPASPSGNPFLLANNVRAAFPDYILHSLYCQSTAPVARDAFGRAAGVPAAGMYNINTHGSPHIFYPKSEPWNLIYVDSCAEAPNAASLRLCDAVGDHYIVYSTGCYTAAFDSFISMENCSPNDTIVADAFTNFYPTTLGVAYLGNTRAGQGQGVVLQKHFWRSFFGSGLVSAPAPSLGVAEGLSKVAYAAASGGGANRVRHMHNLFGSPELEPWIMPPNTMLVQAPSTIPKGVPVQFLVQVRDAGGVGISGVRVCLHKNDDVYQVGWTTSQGVASFAVQAESSGTLFVTCTRSRGQVVPVQQYLPGQVTCQVTPSGEGPQSRENGLPKVLGFTDMTPNPVFGDVAVRYGVPTKGRVKLMLCDAQGRVERVLRDGEMNPGYYRETFRKDGRSLPAGVHFLALAQNGERVTRKLVLAE